MKEIRYKSIIIKSEYYLLFLLICAPFLLPEVVLESLPIVDILLTYISIVCMLIFIFLNIRRIKVSSAILCNLYLFIIFLITYFINREQLLTYFFQIWKVFLMCMVVSAVLENNSRISSSFLLAIRDFTSVFFIADIIYSVIYHEVLVYECLYGNVNSTVKCIMPGIICALILDKKNNKLGKSTVLYFGGFLFLFLYSYHMVTAFVALFFLFVWILLQKIIKERIRIFYLTVITIIAVFESAIIMASNSELLIKVATFFGKSTNFSGRFYLWRNTIKYIKNSFIWGYGYVDSYTIRRIIGNSHGSHNYYLDVMLKGGIVGVILLILLIIVPFFVMRKKNYIDRLSNVEYIIVGAWLAYLIMFLTEPWSGWEVTFLPVICSFFVIHSQEIRSQ